MRNSREAPSNRPRPAFSRSRKGLLADNGRWRPARGLNRGRGMDLMAKLMDDVQVDTGERGTTVTMRRLLGGGKPR